jgi:hypothetical protein
VPGSFFQFRRGIGLLLDRGVSAVAKGALLPPSQGEMEESEAWAATIASTEGPPAQRDLRVNDAEDVRRCARC